VIERRTKLLSPKPGFADSSSLQQSGSPQKPNCQYVTKYLIKEQNVAQLARPPEKN
jgi:hypothetical protein